MATPNFKEMQMAEQVTPEVGMGATYYVGSDRYPFTIVEVVNEKTLVIQADEFKRIDKNGFSESQEYTYSPNPEARKIVITKRKTGRWVEKGQSSDCGSGYGIGHRRAYQDPSF